MPEVRIIRHLPKQGRFHVHRKRLARKDFAKMIILWISFVPALQQPLPIIRTLARPQAARVWTVVGVGSIP